MEDMAFSENNSMVQDHAHIVGSPEVGHGVIQKTANDQVQESGHDYAAIASQFDSGDYHSGPAMQVYPDVLKSDTTSGSEAHMSANASVVSEEHNGKHHSILASHSHQYEDGEQSEGEGLCQVDGGNDSDGKHNGQTGIGRSSVQGLTAFATSQSFGPSATSTPAPSSMNRAHQRLRSNSGQLWTESMNRSMSMHPTPTQPPRLGCYSDGYSSQYYRTAPRYAYGYSEGMQPIWYDQSAMTAMDPGYFQRNTPQPQMSSQPFFQSGYVSQSPVSPGQYYGWPPWMSSYYPQLPPPPSQSHAYYPASTPTPASYHYPSPYLQLPPPPPPPVFHTAYPAPALHMPPPMPLRQDSPADSKEAAPSNAPPALSAREKQKRDKKASEAAREKIKRDAELEKKNRHKQKREKQFRDAVFERIQRVEELEREAEEARKAKAEARAKAKKEEAEARARAEAEAKKAEGEARAKAEKEEAEAREKAKKAEEEARAKAEEEARARALAKKAEAEARARAEAEARAKVKEAERVAIEKANILKEQQARARANEEMQRTMQLKALERAEIIAEEQRLLRELNREKGEELEAIVRGTVRTSRGDRRPVSHESPENRTPALGRELRYEDTVKISFPDLPVRASSQKASEKRKPSPIKEPRYEDFFKTTVPQHANKLAHDINEFLELAETNKTKTGKLSDLRNGSEPEYSLNRETKTVIGMGRRAVNRKPAPVSKATFPSFTTTLQEPKETPEQRLEEANAWFHKDNREEPLFRRKVSALAKKHVTTGDDDDDDDEQGPSDTNSAKNHREKETIVLVGDAIASLGAYVSERDKKKSGYFSDFRGLSRRFCSTAVKPDGSVSYFERDPLRSVRSNGVGSGAGVGAGVGAGAGRVGLAGTSTVTSTGAFGNEAGRVSAGRGTAGTIGIGAAGAGLGAAADSIGSSRGSQHRRARANGEKVFLIKPRRPEL